MLNPSLFSASCKNLNSIFMRSSFSIDRNMHLKSSPVIFEYRTSHVPVFATKCSSWMDGWSTWSVDANEPFLNEDGQLSWQRKPTQPQHQNNLATCLRIPSAFQNVIEWRRPENVRDILLRAHFRTPMTGLERPTYGHNLCIKRNHLN